MRVLLTYPLLDEVEDAVLGDNVVYRPDLDRKGPLATTRALLSTRPNVVLTRNSIGASAATAWRGAMPLSPLLLVQHRDGLTAEQPLTELELLNIIAPEVRIGDTEPFEVSALATCERLYNRATNPVAIPPRSPRKISSRAASTLLVGGGIVNLITAYRLVRTGYRVRILDARPDPRGSDDWRRYGCSRGGGNARMFTLTEADNYNEKQVTTGRDMNAMFEAKVSKNGWLIGASNRWDGDERAWIYSHESVPPFLARVYNDDIFAFNRESHRLWEELRSTEPELFEGVGLVNGILRIYTDRAHFEADVARQARVGATRRVLSSEEVAFSYPALADACAGSILTGGIEVVGFTLNIHDFMTRLIDLLEQSGVLFCWNRVGASVRYDADERVVGIAVEGETITADHYVLSPGAYGNDLLSGLRSARKIHGVLGVWVTIDNLVPKLTNSLKIARTGHAAEDANVTLAHDGNHRDVLVVGSGYGYTGSDPANIDDDELKGLYEAVEDTVRLIFPRAWAAASANGGIATTRRLCVRPWTASSLGVFEMRSTARGGLLIVTGGHNTGGFAQSTSVADAVVCALKGRRHPMHERYHPDRLERFLE
jgi:glycine/D-amino acid oxidase-like deaminating enzyme